MSAGLLNLKPDGWPLLGPKKLDMSKSKSALVPPEFLNRPSLPYWSYISLLFSKKKQNFLNLIKKLKFYFPVKTNSTWLQLDLFIYFIFYIFLNLI